MSDITAHTAESTEPPDPCATAALLTRATGLRVWLIDPKGAPTFIPNERDAFWLEMLRQTGDLDRMRDWCASNNGPIILEDQLGLSWSAFADGRQGMAALGPVITSDSLRRRFSLAVSHSGLPDELTSPINEAWNHIPVLSLTLLMNHVILEYQAMHGTRITTQDFELLASSDSPSNAADSTQSHDRSWEFEQMQMHIIETGNIDYPRDPQHATGLAPAIGTMSVGDPLRQAKDAIIVYTALSCRAAVRGGLPEETAYGMSDRYIQRIEAACGTIDVYAIGTAMFDDYVRAVHELKRDRDAGYSDFVNRCLSLIRLHASDPYTLADLAADMGYAEYYLSRRFAAETKNRLPELMRRVKIDHAAALLERTSLPVSEIASSLGFSTPSHFAAAFRAAMGVSPRQWRLGARS